MNNYHKKPIFEVDLNEKSKLFCVLIINFDDLYYQ